MKKLTLRIGAALAILAAPLPALAESIHAVLYKNPQCSCCESYAAYLQQNGFQVDVKPTNELTEISSKAGVPADLEGCHTMFVEGYVVDGLVPVDVIRFLLEELPDHIDGDQAIDDIALDEHGVAAFEIRRNAGLAADLGELVGRFDIDLEAVLLEIGGVAFAATALRILVQHRVDRLREGRQRRGEDCKGGADAEGEFFHLGSPVFKNRDSSDAKDA